MKTRLCLLTSTNTLRSKFLHTQQWRLSVIADLGLQSHQLNQRTQDNFISNYILHYCHCLFTYSVFTTKVVFVKFIYFFYKEKLWKCWKENRNQLAWSNFYLSYCKSRASDTCHRTQLNWIFKPQTCIVSEFIIRIISFNWFETNSRYGEHFTVCPMEEHFRHRVSYRLLYTVGMTSIKWIWKTSYCLKYQCIPLHCNK